MAKKSKKPDPLPPPTNLASKSKKNEDPPPDPNKPQRGLAIGENFGWTGKLPATLLHEHCQKQKWGKVIFDMKKTSAGYIGIVNLSWENPKTKELIKLRMQPDPETYQPKETTNEARHYVATYTLHRINHVKNMKMVLPIIFRDYWTALEKERLALLKTNKEEHDFKFNANPFTAFIEKREKREKREKERLLRQQNELKMKKPTISIGPTNSLPKKGAVSGNARPTTGPNSMSPGGTASTKASKLANQAQLQTTRTSFPRKVWASAPFIDFSSEIRASIEDSIKHHVDWVLTKTQASAKSLVSDFSSTLETLGFRPLHIQEAFTYTLTFTSALEWLIFYIPEDDLPPIFAKSDQDSAVSLRISHNIKLEYMLKRLGESGFDNDEIIAELEKHNNDEFLTSIILTRKLIGYQAKDVGPVDDSQQLWEEEIDALKSIGNHKISFQEDRRIVNISLTPENLSADLFQVRLLRCDDYPSNLPGIQIIVADPSFKLAKYIKVSILKQLLSYILENNFVGECMVYLIVEWLESNIASIIDNPGPLVSGTFAPRGTVAASSKSKSKTKTSSRRSKANDINVEQLAQKYQELMNSSKMQSSISDRMRLPAWKKRERIVEAINSHKVTLITGETGSGKSTQAVQFMLDYMNSKGDFKSRIICTQPRRISTMGLAERISDERLSVVGKETGYIIRGENKTGPETRISFVTTGVLLRMLQSFLSSLTNTDEESVFDSLGYIFIDEVHERSVDGDFLLIVLKTVMSRFPDLKIVLMSATINIDTFNSFFGTKVNHIHIEGRTFPIKDYYLDSILDDLNFTIMSDDGEQLQPKADSRFFKLGNLNYDLIAQLCLKIASDSTGSDGSFLIFLPGVMEINRTIKKIEELFSSKRMDCWCLPLHSALSPSEQKKVFLRPPKGARKIVVATNVAETSITIPDCVVVIDSGRSKSLFYDSQMDATKLVENWCSKAEVGQRRGRSGRITNGTCYHLYTTETQAQMLAQPIPEIMRTRLENLYLVVKSMGIDNVEAFLNSGIDPPDLSSLAKSLQLLTEMGALNEGSLTYLGKYLSYLPTDLPSGKLLILGCIFGCLDIALTLAAVSSSGSPFLNSFENRDNIKQVQSSFSKGHGDFIALAIAFDEYNMMRLKGQNSKKFIKDNYLSYLNLTTISSTREQFVSILKNIGFVPMSYNSRNKEMFPNLNRNSTNLTIVLAVLTGAYYPNVARVQYPDAKYFQSSVGAVAMDPDARLSKFWIRNENYEKAGDSSEELPASRAFIHPSSVLFDTSAEGIVSPDLKEFMDEEGNIDMAKARAGYKADLTPKVLLNSKALKAPFVVFGNSHFSTKLYIRELTPTSSLATVLLGGEISYDVGECLNTGRPSPGIVLDNWIPVRTWCKNGVLLKQLRLMLDRLIEEKLSNPESTIITSSQDVLPIIEMVLTQ